MYNNKEEKYTELTYKSSYGQNISFRYEYEDVDIYEVLDAIYTLLVGATFQEESILEGMRDYANDKLEFLKKEDND